MKTFEVTLSERLSVTRSVKANSAQEAEDIIKSMLPVSLVYEEYSDFLVKSEEISDDKKGAPMVAKIGDRWVDEPVF